MSFSFLVHRHQPAAREKNGRRSAATATEGGVGRDWLDPSLEAPLLQAGSGPGPSDGPTARVTTSAIRHRYGDGLARLGDDGVTSRRPPGRRHPLPATGSGVEHKAGQGSMAAVQRARAALAPRRPDHRPGARAVRDLATLRRPGSRSRTQELADRLVAEGHVRAPATVERASARHDDAVPPAMPTELAAVTGVAAIELKMIANSTGLRRTTARQPRPAQHRVSGELLVGRARHRRGPSRRRSVSAAEQPHEAPAPSAPDHEADGARPAEPGAGSWWARPWAAVMNRRDTRKLADRIGRTCASWVPWSALGGTPDAGGRGTCPLDMGAHPHEGTRPEGLGRRPGGTASTDPAGWAAAFAAVRAATSRSGSRVDR